MGHSTTKLLTAHPVDYVIIAIYFLFVLAIGVIVSRRMKSSEDFFLSGRSIPAWVTGLAFLSANLGALEVLGMAAQGAEYGLMTAHFYWIGAIPAMVFLGVFMMPFYYGSKARSVPEYLQKRYNEPTRAVNAITFAVSTLVLSGVSMYGMGLVFHDLLGWDINLTIWLAAGVVLVYTSLGGLTSSIYNEVLQFFLIVLGLAPAGDRRHPGGGRLVGRRLRTCRRRSCTPGTGRRTRRPTPCTSPGRASCSAWASCCRSATGVPTSWWSSAPWPPKTSMPPSGRR